MDKLQQFYNDNQMKETVYKFVCNYLQKVALEKVFKGQDVKAIPEAYRALEGAFAEIDRLYTQPPKTKTPSSR